MKVILIAAKQLDLAKTRLGAAVPAMERAQLAQAMFRDVLTAATASRRADLTAVVTSDPELLEIARACGATGIDEVHPRGLNAAVAFATTILTRLGASELCTLLSDIPMITGADIDEVFEALDSIGAGVVLVPSRDFSGTNVIARSPADAIPTRFGRQSLVKHLEQCRARGIAAKVVRQARPALDLDLPADLIEFVRAGAPTHTLNHLARLGIALN